MVCWRRRRSAGALNQSNEFKRQGYFRTMCVLLLLYLEIKHTPALTFLFFIIPISSAFSHFFSFVFIKLPSLAAIRPFTKLWPQLVLNGLSFVILSLHASTTPSILTAALYFLEFWSTFFQYWLSSRKTFFFSFQERNGICVTFYFSKPFAGDCKGDFFFKCIIIIIIIINLS